MAKRRRHRPCRGDNAPNKHQKILTTSGSSSTAVKHSVLEQFYPRVLTLREYLLSKLPIESKIRRKKVATAGTFHQCQNSLNSLSEEAAAYLANVLDTTLVGVPISTGNSGERSSKWNAYLSTQHENSEISFLGGVDIASQAQSEIVDFCIWLLSGQTLPKGTWQKHLLAQGYRRGPSFRAGGVGGGSVGGLHLVFRNQYVDLIKSSPWPEILRLLGKGGEGVIIDLLVDCSLFYKVVESKGNYFQICGVPLGDLKVLESPKLLSAAIVKSDTIPAETAAPATAVKSPTAIQFVRNRMLYARPVLNSRGVVTFGLRHIHVLNRYTFPSKADVDARDNSEAGSKPAGNADPSTLHVLMYVFPRQFKLHNVFDSILDTRETVQPFKDYTVREDEIQAWLKKNPITKVPRRLRSEALRLVQKLQILHQRCPYDALLKYYCPLQEDKTFSSSCHTSQNTTRSSEGFRTQKPLLLTTPNPGQPPEPTDFEARPKRLSVIGHATPMAKVSAFCRSVLSRIVPDEFWGVGDDQTHNKQAFLNNVDRFVKLRRFESMTLHDVMHSIKISNIPWVSHTNNTRAGGSQSDTFKRLELFHEFIYYIFDSLLIPLIRCNFHVTESSVHRYRIFFFRHDIWKSIAEPAMLQIKHNMFEEVDTATANRVLDGRRLGYSQLRLLPKERGMRPIMNLRRRPLQKRSKMLGSSINSILAPVYNMLTFEKEQEPLKFGSTLFSVGDLYNKLKAFKERIGKTNQPFYICKADVQSAFDTIPQEAVVRLVSSLPTSSKYHISKHVEVKPPDGHAPDVHTKRAKPMRKWVSLANNMRDAQPFSSKVKTLIGPKRKNTVFVGNVGEQTHNKDTLIKLLEEHVQQNLVKIGKKYYRQKNGIPQGSVISSLLCNYFYADLERQYLAFLKPETSLLLRLVDDFLLITTEPEHAKRFLQIMHNGVPQYGVTVNPAKTLVNFEVSINNLKLARLVDSHEFPYCGTLINTKTLHISKNRARRDDSDIMDSLTVEYSKMPGRTFQRKVLNTFKIQCHAMFIDTAHNSHMVVARNVYEIFLESAAKMCAYNKCLPTGKRAGTALVKRTVEGLLEMSCILMRSKGRNLRVGDIGGFSCGIETGEVRWLGLKAFGLVLGKRQTRYGKVVEWIKNELDGMEGRFRRRKVPV